MRTNAQSSGWIVAARVPLGASTRPFAIAIPRPLAAAFAGRSSGTDHGSASTALLWGLSIPGVHGEALSLTNLDEDDNFVVTMMMDEYYARLAEKWFGVDSNDVLAH
jgi:hypothetical protein